MRRAALGAAALAITSGAALAYIPSISTLFRRAALKSDDVDRSRDVTLKGTLQLGGGAPQAASLKRHFPLRCRLQTEAATGKTQEQWNEAALNLAKNLLEFEHRAEACVDREARSHNWQHADTEREL